MTKKHLHGVPQAVLMCCGPSSFVGCCVLFSSRVTKTHQVGPVACSDQEGALQPRPLDLQSCGVSLHPLATYVRPQEPMSALRRCRIPLDYWFPSTTGTFSTVVPVFLKGSGICVYMQSSEIRVTYHERNLQTRPNYLSLSKSKQKARRSSVRASYTSSLIGFS